MPPGWASKGLVSNRHPPSRGLPIFKDGKEVITMPSEIARAMNCCLAGAEAFAALKDGGEEKARRILSTHFALFNDAKGHPTKELDYLISRLKELL